MSRLLSIVLVATLTACQGSGTLLVVEPDVNALPTSTSATGTTVTGPPAGQCGDISEYDLTLGVAVRDGGQPARGVDVWLEDRGWEPGTMLASGVTNDEGLVLLDVIGLTSVEDCWGSLLDYVVVAEDGDLYDERDINTPLYNSILNGTFEADIQGAPLELQ